MSQLADTKLLQDFAGVPVDGIFGPQTASALVKKLGLSGVTTPENGQSGVSRPSGGKVNESGIELIKHFESCLEPDGKGNFMAYPDLGYGWDVATVGWGSTYYPDGSKVKKGDVLDQGDCDDLFEWELGMKSEELSRLLGDTPTNEDQFSALSSFSYNAGTGALSSSTLLKRHREGNYQAAGDEFLKWVYSNGTKLAGLERRRRSERALYLSLPVDYT